MWSSSQPRPPSARWRWEPASKDDGAPIRIDDLLGSHATKPSRSRGYHLSIRQLSEWSQPKSTRTAFARLLGGRMSLDDAE